MQSLPDEFLVLSRQLGQAQQRCSAALAAQAAQIESLQAEVVRLRAAVMVRDTRLAVASEALAELKATVPGLPRRWSLARQVAALAERVTSLSRERLRWQLNSEPPAAQVTPAGPSAAPAFAMARVALPGRAAGPAAPVVAADASLAAAGLVICQTGCISHDDYWRVQGHCRRTGQACILVDQSLAALQGNMLQALAQPPVPHMRPATPGKSAPEPSLGGSVPVSGALSGPVRHLAVKNG